MNITKQPLYVRLFFSLGIIIVVSPMLISNYVAMPDFLRGGMIGLGLGLELIAIIIMRKRKNRMNLCRNSSDTEPSNS